MKKISIYREKPKRSPQEFLRANIWKVVGVGAITFLFNAAFFLVVKKKPGLISNFYHTGKVHNIDGTLAEVEDLERLKIAKSEEKVLAISVVEISREEATTKTPKALARQYLNVHVTDSM